MNTVRIGLVGCGLFGESHMRAYQAVPGVEVTAVYDPAEEKAKEIAQTFGISRISSSLEDLCQDPAVEAVDVVAPKEKHLEPVLTALRAGKEVFVEKPFATDLSHCDQMIEAADAAGRILMVGQILRFETKYVLLQQDIQAKRLGKIASMHARRNRLRSLLERYDRTHPAMDSSIHDVDLMLWYTGERVRRVRGFGRRATGRTTTRSGESWNSKAERWAWWKPSGCCLTRPASAWTTPCRSSAIAAWATSASIRAA